MFSWIVQILIWALSIYTLVVWVRFFMDLGLSLAPQWRPAGPVAVLFEAVFTLTDPPIKFFRKLVPPLRLGQIMLEFGLLLTLIACNVASWALTRLLVLL